MNIKISSQARPKINLPFCINSDEKFYAYQDTLRRWSMVGSFLWALIVLVLLIEFFSTKIRARLARGER